MRRATERMLNTIIAFAIGAGSALCLHADGKTWEVAFTNGLMLAVIVRVVIGMFLE